MNFFVYFYSTIHGDSLLLEFWTQQDAEEHIEEILQEDPFLKREHILVIKGDRI